MAHLFVISAPSGTGKTSLIHAILNDEMSEKTKLGISCTTRKIRDDEENGVSYFFLKEDEFSQKINDDEFLEFAEVFGNFYGTPKAWVLSTLSEGYNVILELDVQGAIQVKKAFPEATTIFIIPPSYADLENRLSKRNQDSQAEIKKRLSKAKEEIKSGEDFEYLVTNDNFDSAFADLASIVFSNKGINSERKNLASKCLDHLLDH